LIKNESDDNSQDALREMYKNEKDLLEGIRVGGKQITKDELELIMSQLCPSTDQRENNCFVIDTNNNERIALTISTPDFDSLT